MTLTAEHPTAPSTAHAAAYSRGANKTYGIGDTEVVALDNVDVDFMAGDFTAIMGPSGSGKSTLMHCMAGLDRMDSGSAFIGDIDIAVASEKELTLLRRDRLGFVFQAFNLVPTLSAIENITLPMDLAGRKPDKEWVDNVVDTVGLSDRLAHRPGELSGGQQQRVAIARALAGDPKVLLADEPTGNLDTVMARQVMDLLHEINDNGTTIIMVTHDPELASRAQRNIRILDGEVSVVQAVNTDVLVNREVQESAQV
jgi:putative ABC transport system ATP-binding protein